jgi:hypothetical protein
MRVEYEIFTQNFKWKTLGDHITGEIILLEEGWY